MVSVITTNGDNMIKLYGFGQCFNLMDASPFVVKIDLFLKMSNLPYTVSSRVRNLKLSPKGKLPFIKDEGKSIADSTVILEYLTDKYQLKLDEKLTAEQSAQAYLLTKSLDEGFYWCLVYSRWSLAGNWAVVKDAFFGDMPLPLRWFVPSIARKSVLKGLHGQGFGRHSEAEILAITGKILSSLSVLLMDKNYFFGDDYCSFDAVVYSHLCQLISVRYANGFESDFNKRAKQYDNLVQFCQRIENQFYNE
jgi:glutathione S-transferase